MNFFQILTENIFEKININFQAVLHKVAQDNYKQNFIFLVQTFSYNISKNLEGVRSIFTK
jgi:hypothetical protein